MEHRINLMGLTLGLLVTSTAFISSCYGYSTFYVGGKDGWVIDPHESYNHWAERNRFHVNDTLVFKYEEGLDSVLVVNEEAYHNCNKTNPKETLNDGNSLFKFKRSGPFFFISGKDDRCEDGQKLFIVVMGVRHHSKTSSVHSSTTTAAPPTPAPAQAPSTMLQGNDRHRPNVNTPAPAPAPAASGVASAVSGGWIGLLLCLGFSSVFF